MKNGEITDPLFRKAVEAIDSGDITTLRQLIEKHPYLVTDRLAFPEEGYFKDPYLLWFVADNPIRNGKLAVNIADVTAYLIEQVQLFAVETTQQQLDYALGLVATGRIPRESGAQLKMMDLLIDAGAQPGSGLGALAHGNLEAARHLVKRGGKLTLAAAVILDMRADVDRLWPSSGPDEQLTALTAAAFYGKAPMISFLLGKGADTNGYPQTSSGFHSHATPLHQAVSSGSLECVQLLVKAGAGLDVKDKIYGGTPLGWAEYGQTGDVPDDQKRNFAAIAEYLASQSQ